MADSQGHLGGGGSSPSSSLGGGGGGGGAPQPPSRGASATTGRQLLPVGSAAAAAAAGVAVVPPSLHSSTPKPSSSMIIASGLVTGPRIVILHRYNGDFGFTLRHFIVYPPDSLTDHTANPLASVGMLNFVQPMDTVFVKKVHQNTPAHRAGLQEGDRLLAVNGVPVTSIPYSQVVATIQQTPKTLTLQVVPKNYDILQTFFSETAHNPETNQRPQPQQLYAPKPPVMAAGGAYPKTKPTPPASTATAATSSSSVGTLTVEGVQEKQESLYSTLQEIVSENVGATSKPPAEVPKMLIQSGHHLQKSMVPVATKPYDYDALKQQQQQQQYLHLQQQQQQYMQKMPDATVDGSYPPLIDGDSAIMSRLRKSLEQKEEFLRRPTTTAAAALAADVQQREFYARPNRLQKSVWPPSPTPLELTDGSQPPAGATTTSPSGAQSAAITITTATKPMVVNSTSILREHATQLSAIREHFFTGGIGGSLQMPAPKATPPPALAIAPATVAIATGPSSPTGGATVPLSPHSMHAVSEKAKLFESGRPLSPEGIDRMDLYKSELSRINTKQVVPNVAVRRKEFELKAESTGWRKSIEDKPRSVSSDSESRRTPVRLRSLSVESNATRDSRHSLASSSLLSNDPFEPPVQSLHDKDMKDQPSMPSPPSTTVTAPVPMLRQKPIRDDAASAISYRNAVRNSTDGSVPTVVMRQKQPHHPAGGLVLDDDERKMRRISYLRATAHENLFQMLESDADSSPMSLPPAADTPDADPEEEPVAQKPHAGDDSAPSALGKAAMQPQQLKSSSTISHGTKSKALAHFRDGAADSTEPVVRAGELHVKVTLIDGKRSADRSWRTVHAELRGHHLKLTLVREGKNSNQSPEPCGGTIDLTNFHVTEGNYTKRKNVFKLTTAVAPYFPLEGTPSAAGYGMHAEVHRTQSASGLASVVVGGGGSSTGSSGGNACGTTRSASTVGLPGSERELLLQADSLSDMQQWMESLELVCRGGSTSQLHSPDYLASGRGGQQAEPQRVAAQTSVQVHGGGGGGNSGDDYSPVLPAKSHRKYALGTRSPSGQSPVTKSRKTPQTAAGCSSPTGSADAPIVPTVVSNQQYHQHHHQPQHLLLPAQHPQPYGGSAKDSSDRESGSPKSKTWKGIVARQFRKMQGQGPPGSPGATNAPELLPLPDGASINVPLQHCPVSEEYPYVPLVLTKCTGIVESKGLGVVGIYRIPGNTAAITQLTETINRGLDETALRDPRWDDVNVVSSLLKSFIRNLPEPLLPNELYGGFIAADKLGGQRRLLELRQLLHRVPPMNYETLKHLMRHLHRVSAHSEVNLMDPRNLAIVFGPSVVRSANESLETAVKDMRHQCQIVEVLINYYQYFFEDGLLPNVDESKQGAGTVVDSGLEVPSASLLLDNVAKIEPFKEQSKESSSGFVANIVQAANRKIRRTAQRKHTMSSTTPDTLSLDSTTSAESKEQSSRVIRRYPDLKAGLSAGPAHQPMHVGGDAAGGGIGTASTISGGVAGPIGGGPGGGPAEPSAVDDSQLQLLHHHHHHHHHYYHSSSSRHHSSQSADDASSVLNRSSEDDSNDSAFTDNGSMSLKTVTIALDNKLRSLRDSSIDSEALESDGDLSAGGYGGGPGRHSSLHQQWSHMGRTASRPLTLGENIPYADESPERPLIQGRAKPHRTSVANNNNSAGHQDEIIVVQTTPSKQQQLKKALPTPAHSQKSLDSGGTIHSGTTNDSCLTLVNEADATLVDGGSVADPVEDGIVVGGTKQTARNVSLSSDETDTSTTSNPREKLTAATYRIDTEKLKKMNRILTQLERKANNLERKFNLNRSLSLNYKSPKAVDCCCATHHGLPQAPHQAPPTHCCQHQQQVQQVQQQVISNNLNNNSTTCHNHNGAAGVSLRTRFSLTKDEKTDKNINRRRQIHDTSGGLGPATSSAGGNGNASGGSNSDSDGDDGGGEQNDGPQLILTTAATVAPPSANATQRQRRHVGSRSIRRRHTVGGTHDYYPSKINAPHHHHHHHHQHQPHHYHHQAHHHQHHQPAAPHHGCCPVPQPN